MASEVHTGSLTAVGRSQPTASVAAPLMRILLSLPPTSVARRSWRWVLVTLVACRLGSQARAWVQKVRFTRYIKAQQLKPEPTWREILGRQGKHVVAGYVELALVAATTFAGVAVGLYREFLQGQFYVAQSVQGRGQWRRLLWLFPLTTVVSAFIGQVTESCKAWVALSWRRAVTCKLHELYFDRRAYYHILNQSQGVPDADTRICNDVREACDAYAGVMSGAVQTTVSILMQYGSIASRVAWTDRGWVLVPPFFVLCVVPAAMSTIDYGKLWPIYGEMQHFGGAYNQALTRVQLHSDRICMLKGERFEHEVLGYHLGGVLAAFRKMLKASFFKDVVEGVLFSGLFPSGFQALSTFTSAGIIAGEVLQRMDPKQELMSLQAPRQDVMAYFAGYIRNWWGVVAAAGTLSGFLNTWSSLVEGQAAVQRVSSLFACMQEVRANLPEARPGAFEDRGPVIAFDNVTVATPAGQTLLEKLSFEVNPGDRLLICGHNGAGKSSIIRCLGALWPTVEGTITRPGRLEEVYYLPQKPCSVIGTLADQLTYPVRGGLEERELRSWLQCVDLEHLADREELRTSGETDWEKLLSLGEQQALALARLLYHCPRFAVLDECTSAVSGTLERRLFELAPALGITCVTITHRPALQELHGRMLRLTGRREEDPKGWELVDLPQRVALPSVAPLAESRQEALRRAQKLLQGATITRPAASHTTALPTVAPKLARQRWPTALERCWALLQPALRRRMAWQLVLVVLGMRLHCDLLWQTWSCQMGAVAAGLVGDSRGVLAELLSYLCVAPLLSLVDTVVKYQGRALMCDLAEGISQHLLQLALNGGALLGVMQPGSGVENPMQCIAQVGSHMEGMGQALLELGFRCSHGLYTLRTLFRGVGPVALLSPMTYFAVFRLCLLVAPDFGFLSRRESELEARLQVWHTRLKHFAEPVAFSGGGQTERRAIDAHLDTVLDFRVQALLRKFAYRLVESLFSNHSYLPLYLQRLLSQRFASHNAPASPAGISPIVVVQGFMFERSIMYCETMTHRLGSFTPTWREWDGMHTRLLDLAAALETAASAQPSLTLGPDGSGIEVQDLDLVVPANGACLARGLNFTVGDGAGLVVSGPNASGKSLLCAVLLGLTAPHGIVRMPALAAGRPPLSLLMPAPQRIYLPPGTLGDQVCYPSRFSVAMSDTSRMEQALTSAGLSYLIHRDVRGFFHECRWEDVLSGGEQQRMGMARVLFQRPRFALLDECTSMVAHGDEENLYRVLVQDFGITPITCSQRLFLPDVHSHELKLGTGTWEGSVLTVLHKGGETAAGAS